MADPYPALGSNYRPPIETYTTNRGLRFIAEEVAEIEPRLVNWATKDAGTNPGDGFATVERDPSKYTAEGVRYDNFVPLLVNLVKRQKAEIESLKARLDAAGL